MADSKVINYAREFELIWENPNPTASFDTQTIEVDMSDKRWFMIEVRLSNTANHGMYYEFPTYSDDIDGTLTISITGNIFVDSSHAGTTGTPYLYTRFVKPVAFGIYFSTAYRKHTNATTVASTSVNWIIPVRIWAR